jgi:hypothetical protein
MEGRVPENKRRASAVEIKAEIDSRISALGDDKSKCRDCRVSLPRTANERERRFYVANWTVDSIRPHVFGCDATLYSVIVQVMRQFDCSDWD